MHASVMLHSSHAVLPDQIIMMIALIRTHRLQVVDVAEVARGPPEHKVLLQLREVERPPSLDQRRQRKPIVTEM